jgi:hypothetical protein
MSMNGISWILAAATSVWFGFLAVRAGKSWVLWGLAGGSFGLVSSTFIFGLGHATGIPFSDRDRTVLHIEWTLAAFALILLVGGLLTWSLWRKTQGVVPGINQAGENQPVKNAP